jgi:hypothetical protein
LARQRRVSRLPWITEKYIFEVADAVTTAVACVTQTYADTLKKSGQFTLDNQKEALTEAKTQATKLLSAEARKFLVMIYGDLDKYLEARIEAEVLAQKE